MSMSKIECTNDKYSIASPLLRSIALGSHNLAPCIVTYSYFSAFISGNPVMLVRKDKIPANIDAEITIFQSTALITAAVPIVATAV